MNPPLPLPEATIGAYQTRLTRPIRRLAGASVLACDPDDEAAEQEARDQAALARSRPSAAEALRLEVVARLAVYEAIALGDEFTVVGLEAARAALLEAIGRLVVEANSKETLERNFDRLWAERCRVEAVVGALVPQGRMAEVVASLLRGRE